MPYTWLLEPDKPSVQFLRKNIWQVASRTFSVPASDLVIAGITARLKEKNNIEVELFENRYWYLLIDKKQMTLQFSSTHNDLS